MDLFPEMPANKINVIVNSPISWVLDQRLCRTLWDCSNSLNLSMSIGWLWAKQWNHMASIERLELNQNNFTNVLISKYSGWNDRRQSKSKNSWIYKQSCECFQHSKCFICHSMKVTFRQELSYSFTYFRRKVSSITET